MHPKLQLATSIALGGTSFGLALAGFAPFIAIIPGAAALCFVSALGLAKFADTLRNSVKDVTVSIEQNNSDKNNLKTQLQEKDAIILSHGYQVAKLNDDIDEAVEVASAYRDRCIDLELKCAYCGHVQEVAFNPNAPEYECENCKQTNALNTRITVSRITENFDSAVENITSPLG